MDCQPILLRRVTPAERAQKPQVPDPAPETGGLTSIFDVADDTVIDGFAFVIERSVVMPVDFSVGVEILADDSAVNVRPAVHRNIGGRRVKDGRESRARAATRIDIYS